MAKKKVKSFDKKYNLVSSNLLTFVVLFVASVLLSFVSSNPFASNVFYMLAILFGVVSVTFLIAFLVFLFLKMSKK